MRNLRLKWMRTMRCNPMGGTTIAGLLVVQGYLFAQSSPRHKCLHGFQELVAPCGFAVLLET
jgi:hypothetical protein